MSRQYRESIEVRCCSPFQSPEEGSSALGPAPAQFLRGNRLYAVLRVQMSWVETGQWWRSAAPGAGTSGPASGSAVAQAALARAALSGARVTVEEALAGVERTVWRVEASPGRWAGSGVYDICRTTADGSWWLLRTCD